MSYLHGSNDCHEYHGLVRDFNGKLVPRAGASKESEDAQRASRPTIVCLCGSTRFMDEWNHQRRRLTEAGEIVLAIEIVTTQSRDEDQHVDPALKARLDELHKRKIDLADYVLVLNVGGYIGESTKSEIAYAESIGRPVQYLFEGTGESMPVEPSAELVEQGTP